MWIKCQLALRFNTHFHALLCSFFLLNFFVVSFFIDTKSKTITTVKRDVRWRFWVLRIASKRLVVTAGTTELTVEKSKVHKHYIQKKGEKWLD